MEVGALVAKTRRQHAARQQKPVLRAEHRLVGQIDDHLRLRETVLQARQKRDAVLGILPKLLRATGEPRADHLVRQLGDRVPHDRRVVLSVDDHESRRHRREVTSPSIRAVYFSNSSVSTANWMIFSWLWNGYLRQTSTCVPENSTTL